MARDKNTPIYNMKAVSQETGINPDTLRAWERRYGIPNPTRTDGGHRLFSQYEMDMLKWIIERQNEGLSISHSIKLWRQIQERGDDPLVVMPLEFVEEEPSFVMSVTGDQIKDLRDGWIQACIEFNEQQAQHTLSQAFAMYPLETVCFDILQKGLHLLGEEWYKGNVTVQQEHFASSIALRQLQALLGSLSSLPRNNGRLLIACAPEEQHTLPSILLAIMLRRRQFDVINLGANVPIGQMLDAIEAIQPQLVILTAQTLHTAGTLLEMAEHLYQSDVMVAYGGVVFSQISRTRERIPAHFLSVQLDKATKQVEQLLEQQPPTPPIKQLSISYQKALTQFWQEQSKIDLFIRNQLASYDFPIAQIRNANSELAQNIVAALKLGDINIIYTNLEWLEGLLVNHHYRLPRNILKQYFLVYYEACQQALTEDSEPILAWLAQLTHQIQHTQKGAIFS